MKQLMDALWRRARERFATGDSDLLTDLYAYDECARLRAEGKPQRTIKAFCEDVRPLYDRMTAYLCITRRII